MNNIEHMHLEAIEKSEVNINPSYDDNMWITDKNVAAKKSAEITEQIAIEFADYYFRERYNENIYLECRTSEQIFQEFLKTKQ